jgi:AcrR family transcriptional regulator
VSAKVVDKKEKKDLIIEAAIREFIKKGFPKTTISDIAQAAGIGKGTVYEYFSTKEEIVNQTFEYFVRSLEIDFEAVLISGLPALEKLKQIFNGFIDFMDSQAQDMIELMFDFWSESMRSKDQSKNMIYREMKKFYQAYRAVFADIIVEGMGDGAFRKDINPHSAASMVVGALDGIIVQWVLERESYDYRDVIKTISAVFIKGILTENK